MIDLLPAPPERDLPPGRRSSMRSELVRAVSLASVDRAVADRAVRLHRPTRRRRLGLASLAAAVLVAVALLALPVVLPFGSPASIDPATASLLHRFSSRALKTPQEPAPQPGQYVYERTRSSVLYAFTSSGTGASFRYFTPSTEEQWLGTDGSGRSASSIGQPTFLTNADRQAYEGYVASGYMEEEWGGFDWGRTYTDASRAGELIFFDFSDLPTDVDELKGMIERREIIGGPEGDWETFNLSADILTWSYAPPELRAALFEVMATLPGISASGQTHDAFGRPGIVVGYTHDDWRQEIVLDRRTGQVLERRWVSVFGDPEPPAPGDVCTGPPKACGAGEMWIAGPPGTLSSVTTYRVYGAVVDDIGDVPSGDRST